MIQLDPAAHARSSAACERCMAYERFIADVEAVGDADAAAIYDVALLLFETLHVPASDGAWCAIVRGVARIVGNARVRATCGPSANGYADSWLRTPICCNAERSLEESHGLPRLRRIRTPIRRPAI